MKGILGILEKREIEKMVAGGDNKSNQMIHVSIIMANVGEIVIQSWFL